jgi:NAD(P)-dependent dehydrogenase (short-subunit alcohol dehydrogenase family)
MDWGYRVFGSVRKLEDADQLLRTHETLFCPLVFDVRNRESVVAAAQLTAEKLSGQPLAALVNNAGLAVFGPMECIDDQRFEETVAVNLIGTRNVTNAFLPFLRVSEQQSGGDTATHTAGKIINISSLSGILNTPMNGAYCVSKHAMESLGEIYRRELLPSGIDVCSIRSGPIQSEIWTKNIGAAQVYKNANYTRMAANTRTIMQNASKSALPAFVIADLVLDIIENRKRKVAYEIGAGSRIAKVLSSFLPVRLADRLISRALMKPVGKS